MAQSVHRSGIPPLGDVQPGTHLCHFYETADDFLRTVVPYLAAGLEGNELCMWLYTEPVSESQARAAMHQGVAGLDRYVEGGLMLFESAADWLLTDGTLNQPYFTSAWEALIAGTKQRGLAGLRIAGCVACLPGLRWADISRYEHDLNESLAGKPMIALCGYPLATTEAAGVLDVARTHQYALAKRAGEWEVVETPAMRLKQLAVRNRQESAIADLGLMAVRGRSIDALMNEAVSLAAQTLGTGQGIIWQVRPEQNDLMLRARIGWDALPSDATIAMDDGSVAKFVFTNDQPVIIWDLDSDPRFERSWVLRDYQIASIVTAVIRGRGRPWGGLSVHSATPRSFSADDLRFVESLANLLALAVERDEHERAERREKETLRTIFDNIPVMISFVDSSGRLTYTNPEWERTLGWTFAETRQLDILAELFPDPRQRLRMQELMTHTDSRWHDFQPRTRDGNVIDSTWADFPLSDGSSIKFGIDVTERKRAEEERERLLATTEEALAKLHAIESITDATLGHMGLDDLLKELLARLRSALQTDLSGVMLFDEVQNQLIVRAINGVPFVKAGMRVPSVSPVWSRLTKDPRPVILDDALAGATPEWREWVTNLLGKIGSAMGAPLIVEEKLIGAVVAGSTAYRQFTGDELDLLHVVAGRVAPAIERARLLETVRAGRERLETLSRRLLAVQEEERRRVAIELHDELGQILTAVKINLESIPTQVGYAVESVERAMQTTRDLALDLRPAMLDDLGLAAALRWYADRFAKQTQIEMHLAIEEIAGLPPALATAAFRVAQEALTNVARHASARNVWLEVRWTPPGLELAVRDDGVGFDVDGARDRAMQGASLGLLGMEERVALSGGTFDIRSAAGSGTEVRANLPMQMKPMRSGA
jgi:PAS domain S-box-containing protein